MRRLAELLPSQGITTAANLFYGFLCVRMLSVPDYAKYTVVFGFLGSLSILSDISLSSSLVPLIGDRIEDRQWIADHVASLRQLSYRAYTVIGPVAVVLFVWVVRHQPWDWEIVLCMIAILLAAAWFARVSGAYGAVLIVRRERKSWYLAQKISSLGTLAVLIAFWFFHWISAFSAILINLAGIIFVGEFYYFRARRLLGVHGHGSKEIRRSMFHLAVPNMPGSIFYALQGQISVFLITIFGQSRGVASVGALGRLAQIYVIFMQMNPILIEPYFAKIKRAQLKSSYFVLVAGVGVMCSCVTAAAYLFPGAFLWVLGPKYANLDLELLLIIAASSINYFSGVLYVVNSSRRFVYWWSAALTIVLTLTVQAIYISTVDLGTMKAVLTLGLISVSTGLFVVILTGIYGFIFGPRDLHGDRQESVSA